MFKQTCVQLKRGSNNVRIVLKIVKDLSDSYYALFIDTYEDCDLVMFESKETFNCSEELLKAFDKVVNEYLRKGYE